MPAQQHGRIRNNYSHAELYLNHYSHLAQSAVANLPGMSSANALKKLGAITPKKAKQNHDGNHA